ncbi:MAG: NUDIX domain-containing protein [Treponema sp.]|nr:NUDIX domain-containing protein [Treponema sp.]MBQ2080266.1 NUDIX domain-containing protein [Treponema sp.]
MSENEIGEIKVGYPDCCFSVGSNWFRYRAAAIIIEDNSFLAIKTKSSPHFYTVGGGVHMNEMADECVLREVKEETGVDYEIDRLAVICENFFVGKEIGLQDLKCHVIEFYYLMKSRGNKDVKSGSYGWTREKEELQWIPLDKLRETNIKPDFLRTRIDEILEGKNLLHIINDER